MEEQRIIFAEDEIKKLKEGHNSFMNRSGYIDFLIFQKLKKKCQICNINYNIHVHHIDGRARTILAWARQSRIRQKARTRRCR